MRGQEVNLKSGQQQIYTPIQPTSSVLGVCAGLVLEFTLCSLGSDFRSSIIGISILY